MAALLPEEQEAFLKSDQEKIILCDVEYHDGTELKLGTFSDYPYILDFNDTTFNWLFSGDTAATNITNVAYDDIIYRVPDIVSKLDSDTTIGTIELLNSSGEYDDYITYAWEGHPIKIYIGSPDWTTKDSFILVFSGICKNITAPSQEILSIGIRDKKEVLNVKVQEEFITHDYLNRLYGAYTGYFIGSQTVNAGIATLTFFGYIPNLEAATYIGRSGLDYENVFFLPITTAYPTTLEIDYNSLTPDQAAELATWTTNTPVTIFGLAGTPFSKNIDNTILSNITFIEIRLTSGMTATEVAYITYQTITALPDFEPDSLATDTMTFDCLLNGDVAVPVDGSQPTGFTLDSLVEGTPSTVETLRITTVAATDLNSTFFKLYSPTKTFVIWYNVDSAGEKPQYIADSEEPFNPGNHEIPDRVLNSVIPVCLGKVFNIEPKLIDATNHVYQVHDGNIKGITEIRANGVPIYSLKQEFVLNESSGALELVEVVEGGNLVEVANNIGCFRLLVHDNNKQITCDVIGPEYSLSGIDLPQYSASSLVAWLALNKTDLTSTDICTETFNSSATPNGFTNDTELGLYLDSDATVYDAMQELASSVGSFVRFGRGSDCGDIRLQIIELEDPKLKAQRINLAGSPILELGRDQIIEKGLTLSSTEAPRHTISLGYNKNWTLQDRSSLAGIIQDAQGDYLYKLDSYTQEFSIYNAQNDEELLARYPLAEDTDVIGTLIYSEAPHTVVADEVEKRRQLRERKRYIFNIETNTSALSVNIGDIVQVVHYRYGFSYGRYGFVIGVSGNLTEKRSIIEVWL